MAGRASMSQTVSVHKNLATSLPPDGYSRFFVIVKILQQTYKTKNQTLKILDVGGCSPYLYECLLNSGLKFDLTIVDILPKPKSIKGKYIQEDITQSQLPSDSFDVVVSTDVLEHIPIDLKQKFVNACVNLSKDLIILAAPFDTPGVDSAEHLVNDFNKKLFGVGQDWLEEHFEFTKPSIDLVSKTLDKTKYPYDHFGANNLYSWTLSAHVNLMDARVGFNKKKLKEIRQTYNANLSESIEFTEPSYRHFFVVFKNQLLQDKNIVNKIANSINQEHYANYVHGLMELVFNRTSDLMTQAEESKEAINDLEQRLMNEKLHTEKLHAQIESKNKTFRKKIQKGIKNPRIATRFVMNKVSRKKLS